MYYEVPDQMIIINHALLMFSFQAKAVLFMGDIDEFFIPQASAREGHAWAPTHRHAGTCQNMCASTNQCSTTASIIVL